MDFVINIVCLTKIIADNIGDVKTNPSVMQGLTNSDLENFDYF